MAHAKLAFMKLIVDNLPRMQEFYERSFGFKQTNAFNTPDFDEVMLAQDGNEFLLLLLAYKDDRRMPDATAHGPTGFVCTDLEASVHKALSAGATLKLAPKDVGPTRVAFVADPDGHEIELIQFV
jgi:lactoylglutathione lyase